MNDQRAGPELRRREWRGAAGLALVVAMLAAASAPAAAQQSLDGDWSLRRGPSHRALLRLDAAGARLTVADSSGVHVYRARLARAGDTTMLLVTRPRGTDSLLVHPYGRRTLFVEHRRGDRTIDKQVYVRLTPDQSTRQEQEMRRAAAKPR